MSNDFNFDFDPSFDFEAELEDIAPKSLPTVISVPLDGNIVTLKEGTLAFPFGLELNSLLAECDAMDSNMAGRLSEIKAISSEMEELRREVAAKLRILDEKKQEIETLLFDDRRRKRMLEHSIRVAENRLRQELENERIRKEFQDSSVAFDKLTAGFKWREFALQHQIEGAKHLATAKRAILGDKMGLGKTLTSLIACDMLQAQKILVVVPDDVVSNFVREIQHWAPHRSVIMLGKQTKLARNMAVDLMRSLDSFIVVINYSAWRKDGSLLDKLVSLRFDTVIMDEAHTIKETTTNAYRGCARVVLAENSCPKCRGAIQKVHKSTDTLGRLADARIYSSTRDYWVCIGKSIPSSELLDDTMAGALMQAGCGWNEIVDVLAKVKREFGDLRSVRNVIPMTGTPILNKPTDLYSLLSLADPERFSSKNDFNTTYCMQDRDGKWIFRPGGLDSLITKLSGKFVARDRKTAGVTLPKQEIIVHSIELDPELYPGQAKVIKDLSRQAMIILENGDKLPVLYTIALITRKRQANVWPAGIELKDENGVVVFSVGDEVRESIKLDRICAKVDREWEGLVPDLTGSGDMTNGERIVIFSQFKTPLIELESRIRSAGISVVRFDGDTPQEIRDQVKIDFDRKYCDKDDYEPKWQVVLANYKTGGVGLNFTAATQMIVLDEEWNPGKQEQAFNRIDRIGQTEETTVHILRLEKSIDDWLADLIENKRNLIAGFDAKIDLQASLLKAMREGDLA